MRQYGLIERLERAGDEPQGAAPALILTDIARTLRETSQKVDAARAAEARIAAAKRKSMPEAHPAGELPQILTQSAAAEDAERPAPRSRLASIRSQLLAPSVMAGALVIVIVLLSAAGNSVWRMSGPDRNAEAPRPKLSGLAPALTDQGAARLAASPSDARPARPALSLDEQVLLERSEEMIVRGDMQAAREQLSRAAAAGSVNAKFALAETFDPNVLAAWGLRERVADVGAARALYLQAHDAGDPRAKRRITALDAAEQ